MDTSDTSDLAIAEKEERGRFLISTPLNMEKLNCSAFPRFLMSHQTESKGDLYTYISDYSYAALLSLDIDQ